MADDRYDRQGRLPGWDQGRLAAATLVVVGLGALGNAAAQALALAGVGRLILCDMDRIERTNLSRAPLFQDADLGRFKVEAAADALCRLAPGLRVDARPLQLGQALGLGELREVDLVLGCLDSRAARLELAGRCGLVAAPWIDGATGPWSGEVRPYLDPDGPCLGCGMEEATRAETDAPRGCLRPADQGPQGAAAPLSLLIGAEMALLAVRFLMGLPVDPAIKVLDGAGGLIAAVRQSRDPGCPFHARLPDPEPIGVSHRGSVADLLSALGPGAVPLAWQSIQLEARCRSCGQRDPRQGPVEPADCPRCGTPMHPRTTLELDRARPDLPLAALGIAPRECLAVRRDGVLRIVQLAPQTPEYPCTIL